MTGDLAGRCGSCVAYKRMGMHPDKGPVGACAREQLPYPLSPLSTCSSYREQGTLAPTRPEPRTSRATAARAAVPFVRTRPFSLGGSPRDPSSLGGSPQSPSTPLEIDLDMDMTTFRAVLTEVLRDELGVGDATIAARWQGGEVILKPGTDTAEKRIPIDALFHKVVMIRDKLRLLEQRINAHAGLSPEDKVSLQQYVTGCYGSLTTFNVLFADPKGDGFKGGGKDE